MCYKTLVCFTASYPFGDKETYFENELFYLSQNFHKVVIIPSYNPYSSTIMRSVPENVTVHQPILKNGFSRLLQGLNNFKFSSLFLRDFFKNKVFSDKSKLIRWLNTYIEYTTSLKLFLESDFDSETTLLYSYWASKPMFIDKKLSDFKMIVRMHGGDFYLNRNKNYLPLRKEIYNASDLLLPISCDIKHVLENYYKINPSKIFLSYLGVNNVAIACAVNTSKAMSFVSCSNVYPLKRVHLIFDMLVELDEEVNWHHFGSGESMIELELHVKSKNNGKVNVVLHGHLEQKDMRTIYENTYFDWFINVSKFEGLPVSIMEAFSYGIPVIATDVGGTREIVNSENGFLIPENFSIYLLRELVLKNNYSKKISAYDTWNLRFNAESNYNVLVNKLKNIA